MRKESCMRGAVLLVGFVLAGCAGVGESKPSSTIAESALTASGVEVTLSLSSDWTGGYCANVVLKNGSTSVVKDWSLAIELNQSTLGSIWSATSSMSGSTLTVTPAAFNQTLSAGGSVTFGFCGTATGSNYRPTLVSAKITGGQSDGAGGATGVGGAQATGGKAATGGTTGVGGAQATGGKAATGGTTGVGGAQATGGKAATGGAQATGGSGTVPACGADTISRAKYCMPQTDGISGLVGSATISGITFNATGSTIAVTTSSALASGAVLSGLSPYNSGACSGAGVNATSLATGQPYSGMSMSIQNRGAVAAAISIYIDSVASGGQHVQRKYPFPQVPADGVAHSYNLTWNSGFTEDCKLPSGSAFDQTKIAGIGFGIDASSTAAALNLLFSDIAFTGAGTASPCTGYCSDPTVFTIAGSYSSGNIGAGAVCRQTTSNFTSGNCGNFVSPRALYINGVAMSCSSSWKPPAKVNGGYCFYAPAGDYAWAYFGAW